MDYDAALAVIFGLILLLQPWWIARSDSQHGRRLDELRSGAAERYFEETRELEAYSPPRPLTLRLVGAALVLAGLGSFFLNA
jgi:hypothetical protein